MTANGRQRLLAAALLATLAAAWLAPEAEPDGGTAVAALAPMPALLDWPQPPDAPAVAADITRGSAPTASGRGTGRALRGATEADAATSKPAAPPPPPFRMFGRFERDGESLAFISHAGRTLTVAAGDALPGEWRVDAIGSDGMLLTYLPLGQTARIPFKAPAQ